MDNLVLMIRVFDLLVGTLKGAAPKGSADKSVLDITKSSRLFTLEIPRKLNNIWDNTASFIQEHLVEVKLAWWNNNTNNNDAGTLDIII